MPSATIDAVRLGAALEKAAAELLAKRNAHGFWEGELSNSALSTATAVTALAIALKHGASFQSAIRNPQSAIGAGLHWLAEHQNADGGWGDTTKSLSNISTTTLCWAAFGAAGADKKFPETVRKARRWLARQSVPPASRRAEGDDKSSAIQGDTAEPGGTPGARFAGDLARAIIARYGKDRTFSVPILTMCALAGRLGEGREAWKHVIPLPFELAACPHQLFAALRLPVVSYALPALIAIGQARHVHAPSRNPLARLIRHATREKTLRVLTTIQPSNGGFLEATPLTSFVTMSLAGSGHANHVVTQRGLKFLLKSQRADGSWPIDTNLSTWCTTLAVDALPSLELEGRVTRVPDQDRGSSGLENSDGDSCNSSLQLIDWLLNQQYKAEHPYTHAAPGGWAWTDLPGGVPDADDTAGALLALAKMRSLPRLRDGVRSGEIVCAAEAGIRWLLDLQNSDGGIPTFCRGWGALPFDRSSADITAHAIRAWLAWQNHLPAALQRKLKRALDRATRFLLKQQLESGGWSPLWFGNQHTATEENLVYGTSRVLPALAALSALGHGGVATRAAQSDAAEWLAAVQNEDGGWGGAAGTPSTVEETALAISALAGTLRQWLSPPKKVEPALARGVEWLSRAVDSGAWREPSPIGFYFAKLWYFERLYPLIFTVEALHAVAERHLEKSSGGA